MNRVMGIGSFDCVVGDWKCMIKQQGCAQACQGNKNTGWPCEGKSQASRVVEMG